MSTNTFHCSREWAKLLLANWDRAVRLWDGGDLFSPVGNQNDQMSYARICCEWLIPNRFQEPHVVAAGLDCYPEQR
jgi:hypothetical protein